MFSFRHSLKIAFLSGLALFLLDASFASVMASGARKDLAKWVNIYPTYHQKHKFIEAKAIKLRLSHLPPEDQRLLHKTYAVETLIELRDGFLISFQCKPHFCEEANSDLVVSKDGKSLLVFFFNEESSTTRCFTSGLQPSELPSSAKELIDQLHKNDAGLIDWVSKFNQLSCKRIPGN